VDGSSADRIGTDRSGYDGTQPPPPPPLFPDPLAGLVTGERYEAKPVPPVVPPTPAPVPQPGPAYVPPTRRAPARKPARAPARQVSGQPEAHVPHAELARRQPEPPSAAQTARPTPKKGRGGLIGCLVVLAALSGLLCNVLREIIEAVVDLLR
jgi:outer membrane biosynthesis protein TonB